MRACLAPDSTRARALCHREQELFFGFLVDVEFFFAHSAQGQQIHHQRHHKKNTQYPWMGKNLGDDLLYVQGRRVTGS